MARPSLVTRENITPLLRGGPISAADLAAILGVNRTTIVRGLAEFGDEVVMLGATRRTRHALRRSTANGANRWPIYRLNETGQGHLWAELESFWAQEWRLVWPGRPPVWAGAFADQEGLWRKFPFFLKGVCPQGFLGRVIGAQLSPTLALPADPDMWTDHELLTYLENHGEDVPGAFVVGDPCLRRALARPLFPHGEQLIPEAEQASRYPAMAEAVARAFPVTWAGGQQPKFLATLQDASGSLRSVIVKFSPPLSEPAGQRWGDLLLCEFHAHAVLAQFGLAAPGARIGDGGGRRFLELPRFDRVGAGGRRGVVSLAALSGEEAGADWTSAALSLQKRGLIDAVGLATVRRLQAFGELIGDTDLQGGNLAFWMADTLPFRVAPAYDKLPMLWAPGPDADLGPRHFAPTPPVPAALEQWREAVGWAALFWERVARDARLSAEFRGITEDAQQVLLRLVKHVG